MGKDGVKRGGGGSGGVSIEFAPMAPGDFPGVRLSMKLCEFCGRGFLRAGVEKDCPPCVARAEERSRAKYMPTPRWTAEELERFERARKDAARRAALTRRAQRYQRQMQQARIGLMPPRRSHSTQAQEAVQ